MSFDPQTDAISGRLNDLISAINNLKAEADQLAVDAAAISMPHVAADCAAASSALDASLAELQKDSQVLSDVRQSA